ncbi:hypothetical protein VUJ46_15905 [Chryseobacterium sp. MYb264]|uniref:hypothetical protein n=1 Tax=Chryseobacterium sp. MYb264 TaxID=2745153 RepID=UPI002E0ED421|nr:hypothetical protein VUJ46_15905 [Chryseobacterium sp. MYb264]
MKNIWFTMYVLPKHNDKYIRLGNYRTLLEILMIPAIQNKINRNKKAQKIMFCLIPEMDEDLIDSFRSNYFNKERLNGGIINFNATSKGINWNSYTDQERKDFLIEKWKVLFANLSDDYFVVDKSEIIDSLEKLRKEDWKQTSLLFKKRLKYNREAYSVVMDISVERAKLALVRDSDEKCFVLKEYEEVWRIMTDANFKNFKLDGDILSFENKTFFLEPEVFDLRELIK